MNDEFIKGIYKTLVDEGVMIYKDLYENTSITGNIIEYWKQALKLYQTLTDEEKKIFFEIIKQTIIDTVSGMFGVIDGSSTLSGADCDISIKINGVDTDNDLQDGFLEFIEKNQ